MSGSGLLLDSVVLIDHLNGFELATSYIREHLEVSHVSAITRAEVLTGLAEEDLPIGIQLLDQFPLVVIDAPIADLAARLRRENRWRLPDALQAAAARHHGLTFVTRNTKDFPPSRHKFVRVPYKL